MLKASLLLILVLAWCTAEEDNTNATSTTITVLALNHRPSPFLSSEINALALQAAEDATQQERLTSLPQSSKSLPPSAEKKHRPGTVTSLGVINLDDEAKQLPQRGPNNHKAASATTPATTTEVNVVTSNPRPTKRISSAGTKKSKSAPFGNGLLRNEPWVLPLLVLSAIVLFTMTTFEVFVLCRAKRAAPSRRHLFLGQMLLLGVFMCVLLAALQALTPSFVTCAMTRLGVGLAYAIVFATLLVKSVFLISLNGGVYLPAPYQALLLLFAVLIQVAVGSQWLLNAPPRIFAPDDVPTAKPTSPTPRGNNVGSRISSHQVITASDVTPIKGAPPPPEPYGAPLCATPYEDSLAALIYVVFLMGFVGILAAKSRGIRENYRESTYIGLSIACCAPLWLGWALAGLALAPRHQDATIGFGLLATGVVVFSLMFLPRGRQLAAMGRDGRYAEDGGEERFSSLSPSAMAGYSPSFFHFKPAPPHTILTSKNGAAYYPPHLMGDRVALVPAPPLPQKKQPPPQAPMQMMPVAPPSYPRLLHYYPYLVYPPRYHPGPGLYMKPDDGNMYTTLEPTLSSNPNVFFQRNGHSGMLY
ncbi:uncharacterized protein LOC132199980 [Neocloeon triangulifer]|uniref:uncharacterized protein LOC132199980 n=1 Tax=Neocloeon triangulifer TaxID=2078957 RepID=UPI00286F574D|nr:uncharacterized protein LOC132199980 [Neocloeon triangulifer]XP_059481098.1 uncharacterized protein LOC132199980 [Neocloeon triangulifer]